MPESRRHPLTRAIKATKRDIARARRLLERSEQRLDVLSRLKLLTTDGRRDLRDEERADDERRLREIKS